MPGVVNGNKVFFDKVRGRWTVLFTQKQLRKQYGSEAEAIAAAGADGDATTTRGGSTNKIVNGHRIFFDPAFGNWTLETDTRRTDHATEQDAIDAANALPPGGQGQTAKENNEVVPKQAVASKVKEKSKATNELDEKVQTSIQQRVATEGSVVATKVGTEKDGFTSLTETTTKGNSAEGPAVASIGANIKQGNVNKQVSSTAKLQSVTGGTKRATGVLDETIVQANVKGMRQGLIKVGVPKAKVTQALSESSPIPSVVTAAITVENQGGIVSQAKENVSKASGQISAELKNPFGSLNPFGSVGSSFGNIFATIVGLALNGPKYQSPLSPTSLLTSADILNRQNIKVPTPNIVNSNGTTNLKRVVHKSKLQAPDTDYKSEQNRYVKAVDKPSGKSDNMKLRKSWKPGEATIEYNGALTRLKGDYPLQIAGRVQNDGGDYIFPYFNSKEMVNAELRTIERPITQLIIMHLPGDFFKGFRPMMEEYHQRWRASRLKKFGDTKVNAEPLTYGFPTHIFSNSLGALNIVHPLELEVPRKNGTVPVGNFANSIRFFLDGSGADGNKVTPNQMTTLGWFIDEFIDVFPGAEILGVNEVSDEEKFSRVPFFDVRDFVNSRNRKPSVLPDTPGETVTVPPPEELSDQTPKNVVVPKKNPNVRPTAASVADDVNSKLTSRSVSEANYSKAQDDLLKDLKRKKDTILDADKLTGDGLAGAAKDKISSLSSNADSLLKGSIGLKLDNLKNNKVFDTVKGIFS